MTTDPRYFDLVQIGEGPVASVFAGVDAATGEALALKVFPGPLPRRSRTDLERELARLRPLAAEVPLLAPDAVEALPDGRAAVRVTLCSQSLTELIDSFGPLSVADALALGQALATALMAIHHAGIVHGGVTPANVLFLADGAPVLADAGLALRTAFPADAQHGLPFRAPETVRDAVNDERCDLYGLGAVLYLALAGQPPHPPVAGERPGDHILRVLGAPVAPLTRPDLPAGLAKLVLGLLAQDPAKRPIDAGFVAERLHAIASDPGVSWELSPHTPTGGEPPDPFDRGTAEEPPAHRPGDKLVAVSGLPPRPSRGGRAGLVLGLSAMAAAVLVVVALLLQDDPAPLSAPPAPAESASATGPVSSASPPVQALALDAPVDQVNFVELTWHAEGELEFFVVVAGDGQPLKTIYADRDRTLRVPVDPVRPYCFLVQATNGAQTYQSASRAIRGATCNR